MASIHERVNTKTGVTTYQVQIRRKGYPAINKNFATLQEARTQAVLLEAALLKNENINPREATKWTISDLIDWYIKNPDPHKKLENKKHFNRLYFLKEEFAHFTVASLTPQILSKWINKRLKINQPSTVYHYYVALKNAMLHHSIQHNYSQNIFNVVRCPSKPGERNRRFSGEETAILFKSIRELSRTKKNEMMVSVLFALETGCRIGEMLQLKWNEVNLEKQYVDFLAHTTKTKSKRRATISSIAVKILKWIKKHHNPNNKQTERVFSFWHLNEHHLSRQFQICCRRAEIDDIRWHDLRHEATSRFYEYVNKKTNQTLSDMEIASITGHKSMNMLRKYAHLRPDTIAPKLW